jgi:uncharacterized phage protein gp47/JayE
LVEVNGSTINILVYGVIWSIVEELQSRFVARLTLLNEGLARGEDLDDVVAESTSLDISRRDSTKSVVDVSIARPSTNTNLVAGILPVGTQLVIDGKAFELQDNVLFKNGDAGPKIASCESVDSGSSTRTTKYSEASFFSEPFDSNLTVAVLDRSFGGEDVEDDDSFLERVKRYASSNGKATAEAIEQEALRAGAFYAKAYESISATDPAILVVSDSRGGASQKFVDEIYALIHKKIALGVPLTILTSTERNVSLNLRVLLKNASIKSSVESLIKSLIVEYMSRLGPGQPLFMSRVVGLVQTIPGIICPSDCIRDLDIYPSFRESIRTSENDITINFI